MIKIFFILTIFKFISISHGFSRFGGYEQECGEVQVGVGYIAGGNFSTKGQWPWLASLHYNKNGRYFCGSSIISKRHLLTGENCFN
jgi:secreted trypsin-like serine protease